LYDDAHVKRVENGDTVATEQVKKVSSSIIKKWRLYKQRSFIMYYDEDLTIKEAK
jgi:hypothetical protein